MKYQRLFYILVCLLFTQAGWSQDTGKPLSLDDCIRIALAKNVDVLTFENNAKQASNSARAAYSDILPSIRTSVNASETTQGPSRTIQQVEIPDPNNPDSLVSVYRDVTSPKQSSDFYSFSFNVDQTIFDGGNWWNQIRRGKADKKAARANLDVNINATITTVAQFYFDLLKQEKLLEVNRLAEQRSKDNLEKTQKMFDIGSVAKVDVYRARVNHGNDRISVLNQRTVVKQARQNLNIAMGQDPETAITIQKNTSLSYQLPPLQDMLTSSVANHPELRRRELDVKSKALTANIALSPFLPQLSGFFQYSRSNTEFDLLYTDLDQNYRTQIGATLSMNLFNGFQDQVNYQNAKIEKKNAELALEDYKRTLKSLVTRLYDSYSNQLEVIEINRENLEASREEYRLANERYRLGSGTSLDVREAQVNLTEAERILVAAEYDLIITYAELQETVGQAQQAFK